MEKRWTRQARTPRDDGAAGLALLIAPDGVETPIIPMIGDALPAEVAERSQREISRRLRRRRAVILDVDGTLLDSNEAHALAWLVALHDFGHEVALELLRPLIGMAPERVIYHAIGAPRDPDEGRDILRRKSQIFRTWYLPRLLPFVGTRALLQRMKRDGLHLIAATMAGADEAAELIQASGIGDLLDARVTGSDIENWPDSELVAAALSRSRCSPESVLLLGDTPYDIAAGSRAGVDVVALRCGGWRDAALRGAAAVYNDACDLLRNYSTSPFFSATTAAPYASPRLTLVQ
jgi:phosphoglycolate phosphatase-like HAD superfamily hydrolase